MSAAPAPTVLTFTHDLPPGGLLKRITLTDFTPLRYIDPKRMDKSYPISLEFDYNPAPGSRAIGDRIREAAKEKLLPVPSGLRWPLVRVHSLDSISQSDILVPDINSLPHIFDRMVENGDLPAGELPALKRKFVEEASAAQREAVKRDGVASQAVYCMEQPKPITHARLIRMESGEVHLRLYSRKGWGTKLKDDIEDLIQEACKDAGGKEKAIIHAPGTSVRVGELAGDFYYGFIDAKLPSAALVPAILGNLVMFEIMTEADSRNMLKAFNIVPGNYRAPSAVREGVGG